MDSKRIHSFRFLKEDQNRTCHVTSSHSILEVRGEVFRFTGRQVNWYLHPICYLSQNSIDSPVYLSLSLIEQNNNLKFPEEITELTGVSNKKGIDGSYSYKNNKNDQHQDCQKPEDWALMPVGIC